VDCPFPQQNFNSSKSCYPETFPLSLPLSSSTRNETLKGKHGSRAFLRLAHLEKGNGERLQRVTPAFKSIQTTTGEVERGKSGAKAGRKEKRKETPFHVSTFNVMEFYVVDPSILCFFGYTTNFYSSNSKHNAKCQTHAHTFSYTLFSFFLFQNKSGGG